MSSLRDFSHGAIILYRYSVPTELVRDNLILYGSKIILKRR